MNPLGNEEWQEYVDSPEIRLETAGCHSARSNGAYGQAFFTLGGFPRGRPRVHLRACSEARCRFQGEGFCRFWDDMGGILGRPVCGE